MQTSVPDPPPDRPPRHTPAPRPADALGRRPGWQPFGPPDLELWVGPNLAVARPDGRGRWSLVPPRAAQDHLLRHALTRCPALDAALDGATAATPLGTPLDRAVWANRHALPGFACVLVSAEAGAEAPTAQFLRPPEAVLHLGADRRGNLAWGRWRTGTEALDLLVRHRDALSPAPAPDVLTARPAASEGVTLRRALALGLGGLVLAPILAAPLILVDAVACLVGIAALWVAGLAAGPALLRAWDRDRPQPALRLDPWRRRVPRRLWRAGSDPSPVARGALRARVSWRPAFGVANTGIGGRGASGRNPDQSLLHLTGPGLDLLLVCDRAPPDPARGPVRSQGPEVPAADIPTAALPAPVFWALAQALGAVPVPRAAPVPRAGAPTTPRPATPTELDPSGQSARTGSGPGP